MICILNRLSQVIDTNPCPALMVDPKDITNLQLDKRHFFCCQGDGGFYQNEEQCIKRCSLTSRLARAQRLHQQFHQRWRTSAQLDRAIMTPSEAKFLAKILSPRLLGETIKGRALSTACPPQQPSLKIWHWAFFTLWRFGLPAYVLTLDERAHDGFAERYLQIEDDKPIIFLEQKASLQNAVAANEFDALVNWCEKREACLWLDLLKTNFGPAPAQTGFTAKEKYAEKIAALKNQPPLNWLGPDTRSRLGAVCNDISHFLR